ncbi:TPA: dimethyl sulfoxide reductase anchor subunit [Enterobacter hormaechei subsp. steigerwaltii]|uniref:dimethyl sulfoxide reductase anchor subunit family protein n=1 Tax=Enterobacter hormaechei TaxID=158836 RepID=UPI000D760D9B|nr:DmsC/YnfH family molybdoenzyme membrane anchor subunit [Enterobacter hormaechei]PXY63506.1 dimethyl sulfoxide reductase [Enterobacter hormaechei subsp. steigerwaltii]HED2219930.1 dimethyl sulfoxide reductase anchor subunit [Enterobacter hormaechei subsp. steigerwaltii]HED2223406.1 dimethyl sulfoxide reductase anchor subunit [Enterobacter hormaechei subsp. steigerwaltii]HED2280047.1 dimethyl sulfoxide reductase anchor subunit [Enterobacter hormaechei subsp. steigerwaltii]HED2281044.1 dimethy
MHELPLLIFTLFLQGSVGVTLWLAFGSTQRSALLPAAGAFVLASLGLLASALHMGYPLNALNALRHVSSSWLSREIIFASLYLAALGFATLLMFVKKPGWKPLLVVAGLVGLVDVFCMAQIYMHASVVTWQHVNTLVLFIGSVGIIGSACMAVGTRTQTVRAAVVIITLVVLVRLVMQPVWLADITAMDNTVVTFPHAPLQMLEQLRTVHLLSWCVSVAGMLCFAAGGLKAARSPMLLGSALLIVGELMLRFVFFSIG